MAKRLAINPRAPETKGRLLLALDDFITPKVGKNIFGCETIFDHAAKANQSRYPWAQNVVAVGLLKHVKGCWACLFLDFRFYLPIKTIQARKDTAKLKGHRVPFQTKHGTCGRHAANDCRSLPNDTAARGDGQLVW